MGETWCKRMPLVESAGWRCGLYVFIAQFDDAEGYGKTNDAIVADTEFQELMAKTSALGGEWVRHNLARALF